MNEFFEHLGDRWVEAADRRGARIARPELDARIALELLELARVAAHTQERRFAPLTSYFARVAAGRLRAAKGAGGPELPGYILPGRPKPEREGPRAQQPPQL